MKTITTSRNKTYPITWAQVINRKNGPVQLMIELEESKKAANYVTDFDGLESLKLTDEEQPGTYVMYEGFSRLASMIRKNGAVRITLEKDDAE